jgi:hypothetical protein
MNVTERKPAEELLDSLTGVERVFLVACQGCPVGCETGGQPWLDELTVALTEAGKDVTGSSAIDMICNKASVGSRLIRHAGQLERAQAVVVGSCGVGVQAVGNMVGRLAVPAMDTICMGDYQGLWPSQERCAECGQCMLAQTGGLCPITLCAKSLVNGTCGGTGDDGSCEVTSARRCGWQMIYERLESLGRLDDLKRFQSPRDFSKRSISDARRAGIYWALEVDEEEPSEAEPVEQ